jgi:hypothetical protein
VVHSPDQFNTVRWTNRLAELEAQCCDGRGNPQQFAADEFSCGSWFWIIRYTEDKLRVRRER